MNTVRREISFTIYDHYPSQMIYTIQRDDGSLIAYITMFIHSVYNYKARTTNVKISYVMEFNAFKDITKQERNECEFLLSNLVNTQSHDITTVINDNIAERVNTILPTSLKLVKGGK